MSTHRIPKKPEHLREWIKYQLRTNGSSFSTLAREHGVSRQAVQQVCYTSSPKWERLIAEQIGLSPEDIWPNRYTGCNTGVNIDDKPKVCNDEA